MEVAVGQNLEEFSFCGGLFEEYIAFRSEDRCNFLKKDILGLNVDAWRTRQNGGNTFFKVFSTFSVAKDCFIFLYF